MEVNCELAAEQDANTSLDDKNWNLINVKIRFYQKNKIRKEIISQLKDD